MLFTFIVGTYNIHITSGMAMATVVEHTIETEEFQNGGPY